MPCARTHFPSCQMHRPEDGVAQSQSGSGSLRATRSPAIVIGCGCRPPGSGAHPRCRIQPGMQSLASTAPFCPPRQGQFSSRRHQTSGYRQPHLILASPHWQPDAARLPTLFVPPTLARCPDKRRIAAPPHCRIPGSTGPLLLSHDRDSVCCTRRLTSTAGHPTKLPAALQRQRDACCGAHIGPLNSATARRRCHREIGYDQLPDHSRQDRLSWGL